MKKGFTYRFMSNTNVCRLSCWFWLDIWTHADQLAVISQKEINSLWKSYFTFQGLLNKLNCLVQFRQLRGGFFHPMSQQSQWVAPTLKQNCLQHLVFPGGHPSKYSQGSMLLNFSDQTRTGAFNMIWPKTVTNLAYPPLIVSGASLLPQKYHSQSLTWYTPLI